jgi:hypothetical protein
MRTRGPWRFEEDADDVDDMGRFVGADGTIVCSFGDDTCYYPTAGRPPDGADRQLIAAAPELLEFAELYVEAWKTGEVSDKGLLKVAEQCIAKATGGQ